MVGSVSVDVLFSFDMASRSRVRTSKKCRLYKLAATLYIPTQPLREQLDASWKMSIGTENS